MDETTPLLRVNALWFLQYFSVMVRNWPIENLLPYCNVLEFKICIALFSHFLYYIYKNNTITQK